MSVSIAKCELLSYRGCGLVEEMLYTVFYSFLSYGQRSDQARNSKKRIGVNFVNSASSGITSLMWHSKTLVLY